MIICKLCAMMEAWQAKKDGVTAIEYGLIAAAVAVALAGVIFAFGDELNTLFGNLGGLLEGANASLAAS